MARYSLFNNESLRIDIANDFLNTGWLVSNGVATHDSCNPGFISTKKIEIEPGKEYKVTYTVTERQNGVVYIVFGGQVGTVRNEAGTYTETLIALDDSGISFWSDGDLSIRGIKISDGTVDGTTLVFNDKYRRWIGRRSYVPNLSVKFLDRVMLFTGGEMWEQWTNDIRNNFFGEQYKSEIIFYINTNPTVVKTPASIRIVGNVPWSISEVYVRPRSGKSEGQLSRIKKGNFKRLQGQWFADFLRDMNDPRFSDETLALLNGALLQGEVIRITMETTETSEVRLLSVDTLSPDSQYSY